MTRNAIGIGFGLIVDGADLQTIGSRLANGALLHEVPELVGEQLLSGSGGRREASIAEHEVGSNRVSVGAHRMC